MVVLTGPRTILCWLSVVLVQAACAPGVADAGGPSMPSEWRLPTAEELNPEWRDAGQNRYAWISGDFDGNGKIDGAYLAIRTDMSEGGLLAVMFDEDSGERWFVLTAMPVSDLLRMGVTLRPAGPTKVLGPTLYDEPKHDLLIQNDAIDFFFPESANSLFFWSLSKQDFDREWESD